jgi:putative transposase
LVLVSKVINRYAKKFFIKIEQVSIQHDHIHLLIRTSRRCFYQAFFRVLAGQVAQQFLKDRLVADTPSDRGKVQSFWLYRPFSRVIRGLRAWKIVRNYIQLNEQEVKGVIRYNRQRLKGLSLGEWDLLWT